MAETKEQSEQDMATMRLWAALSRIKMLASPQRPWEPKHTLDLIYQEAINALGPYGTR